MAEEEPYDELEAAERGLLKYSAKDDDEPTRRTRGRSKGKASAIEKYKAGRDAALQDDYDDVYEELDDEEYENIRAQRLADADFIEDDGTGDYDGYYDDGREIFEDEDMLEGTTAAARRARKPRGAGGAGPSKPKIKAQPKRRVNSLFTGGKSSRLGATVVRMGEDGSAAETDSFLAEVLAEQSDEAIASSAGDIDDVTAALARRKRSKQSLAHVALYGSTADARQALLEQNEPEDDEDMVQENDAPTSGRYRRSAARRDADYDGMDLGDMEAPQLAPGVLGSRPNATKASSSAAPGVSTVPSSSVKRIAAPLPPSVPTPASTNTSRVAVASVGEEDEDEDDNAETAARASYLKPTKAAQVENTSDWESVRKEAQQVNETTTEVKVDTSKLPLDEHEGEEVLHFYWLDAYEPPWGHKSGSLYLFGKVFAPEAKTFVSCCLEVSNLQRDLFVLPRTMKLDARGEETLEEVEDQDVYEEVEQLLRSEGIKAFRAKVVKRNYAFEEPDVPREEHKYLKVKYDANLGKLSGDRSGRTFSHIFGTNISPLERFLMKRDLWGPCWLRIRGAKCASQPYSWCKVEATVDNPKNITKVEDQMPAPPVTVLSLSVQTIVNRKTHTNEVVAVAGLVSHQMKLDGKLDHPEKTFSHFTAITKLGDNPFPFDMKSVLQQKRRTVEMCGSERTLLAYLITKVFLIDPDVIVGHNLFGFELDVLLHRIRQFKITQWSRLGRLRRGAQMPNLKPGLGNRTNISAERDMLCGRLLVDTMATARELIRQVSYELSELANTQLDAKRIEIDQDQLPQMFSHSASLLKLLDHVERDSYLVMRLLLKLDVLPLMKQITNITGGIMSRTLSRGRSDRNEFLLCHEFHRRKYIVPDRPAFGANDKKPDEGMEDDLNHEGGEGGAASGNGGGKAKGRRKPAYAGGLVLEPKRGFYDQYILLLDFNSLYPSIIQEYNICFTTVERAHLLAQLKKQEQSAAAADQNAADEADLAAAAALAEGAVEPSATATGEAVSLMADLPDPSLPKGVLPHVLRNLILKRRQVKSLMKSENDANKLAEYDVRQKALKLTANSMYGCLGFKGSRFFARPLAELITSKGREILQKTVDLAQDQLNLDVIYGDTDSIMINTRCTQLDEVKQIGNRVKKEVNALYRELEIDIDGVFKTMLLLKKKKYAALSITEKNGQLVEVAETKGLDIVRRDWSAIAHDVGNYILNRILTQEPGGREQLVEQCHEYLRAVGEDLRTPGKVPLEKFIIHKNLTKDPEAYPDKKAQPHVQVALRMKMAGKSVRALDTIPYVICIDGSDNAFTARAYHPDDLRKNDKLQVDVDYYLKNQVHPVVSRLLEPIEGTNNAQIAECLGLDPSAFRREYTMQDVGEEIGMGLMTQMSDEERFRTAEEWRVSCQSCGQETVFPGVFRKQGDALRCGILCPNTACAATLSPVRLCNLMTLEIRKYIQRYYDGHVVCDDPACRRGDISTRQLSVAGRRCLDPLCRGMVHSIYSDKQLYTQLSYYAYLFDVRHALEQLGDDRATGESLLQGHVAEYDMCKRHADKWLNKSARRHVQLAQLFSCISGPKLV